MTPFGPGWGGGLSGAMKTAPKDRSERMAKTDSTAEHDLLAPVATQLARAGWLSVATALIWPVQAAAIATTISGWVGQADMWLGFAGALVFLVAAVLRASGDYLAQGWLFDAGDQVVATARQDILARAMTAPGPESSAETAALVVQKLPMLSPWITRFHPAMTKVRIVPLALIALVAWQSWAAALILLVAVPLIPLFMALIGMAAEEASRKQLQEIGTMNGMLMERVSAMIDIRLLGASDRALTDFAHRADTLRERTMSVLRVAFLSSTVLELFAALGVAMVAVYVGFSLLGVLTFGTWGAPLGLWQGIFVLVLAPDVFQPLRDLAAAWHDRAGARAVIDELAQAKCASRRAMLGKGAPAAPLAGPVAVSLRGAYVDVPGRRISLPDIDVAQGDALALTGPSGAGKSTLLAVLAGLMPLSGGQLSVCGKPLTDETADPWRARLAFMPQRVHFPDVSLAEILDPLARGADPWPALDLARAGHVVKRLPDGLNTRLGETGGGVSGGEARRLMIARAVLMDREVLLADEPTADLDPDTAALIIEALLALKARGMTLVVATHDPVLIDALDRTVEVGG